MSSELVSEESDSHTTPTKINVDDESWGAPKNITPGQPKEQAKRKKSKRKTGSKVDANLKNEVNEISVQKQAKLTEIWKGNHCIISESKSKKNFSASGDDFLKKKIEEELQSKNKAIDRLKNEKEVIQKKYIQLSNDRETYKSKAVQVIRQSLLAVAQMKRKERGRIYPDLGYFKQNVFIQGPIIKSLAEKINKKIEQIEKNKSRISSYHKKQNKDSLKFKERFFQKELDELTAELKDREKEVVAYKEKLRFAEKEKNCKYYRMDWPIVAERFQTLELLGSGGFGEVYKCFDLHQNCYVALKECKYNATGSRAEEQREQFLKHVNREIKIQKTLHHPNIAKLIDIIKISESEVSFVLEYCSGPELSKYYKKSQCLQEKEAKEIIRQIIYALKYLYEQNHKIIHYDLKPTNIMFHNGVVKILDFGLCKQMDTEDTKIDLTSQGVGTYWYLPPQTFRDVDCEVSCKVDIWSVGVIFFQLLYGRRPFGHGVSQEKIFREGIILKAVKVEFPEQTPMKFKVSEAAKKFIKECLKYDQNERLSPEEAYNHEYFK